MSYCDIIDKLDIFLITYNRCEELNDTLSELLSEKSPIKNFPIKIIDNNSTDDTYKVVQKFMQMHKNISYEKNRHNIGGNANIMNAFYQAKKEYVWVLADNDHYCWDSWHEVEKAIEEKQDAIMVSTYNCPQLSIAQCFYQSTFLPGVIYKTEYINDAVMTNMAFNISNMFPHAALFAYLVNNNKNIYLVQNGIVEIGDNKDKKTGIQDFTRGYKKDELHPLMKNMTWSAGYANTVYMIQNKRLRSAIISEKMFSPNLYSADFLESKDQNESARNLTTYNIACIFAVLSPLFRIRFIINLILYFTLYRIIYIYSVTPRPARGSKKIQKKWRIRLFRKITLSIKKEQPIKKYDSKMYCPILNNFETH